MKYFLLFLIGCSHIQEKIINVSQPDEIKACHLKLDNCLTHGRIELCKTPSEYCFETMNECVNDEKEVSSKGKCKWQIVK